MFVVASASLNRYMGDLYVQNGKLWCKNTGRGDQITMLSHIKADWFTLNEQVHFQFMQRLLVALQA
ncbi:hypothetical protein GCM10028805_65030 [Spirosoma harenae]